MDAVGEVWVRGDEGGETSGVRGFAFEVKFLSKSVGDEIYRMVREKMVRGGTESVN